MALLMVGRNIRRLILLLILLTVLVHTVIILHINTKVRLEKKKKVVRDHEEALCNFRLNRSTAWTSKIGRQCPEDGIVTVFYGGGLESQMWAYSSVWAVASVTNLKPFIPICIHSFLSKFFDDLSIPPLSEISDCDISLPNAATSFDEWLGQNQSLVLPVFSCLYDSVFNNLDGIIREFRLKRYLLDRGNQMLLDFAAGRADSPVFVGVPIPGHWESVADGLNYPDEDYYRRVFNHIRGIYNSKTVFVIVSDEEINRASFPGNDVMFVHTFPSQLGLDLALLTLCNVSVLGFEGIGLWGALLSKGEAFLFQSFNDNFDLYLSSLQRFHIYE